MKRLIPSMLALALFTLSTAPASTFTYSNDPSQFRDSIDWCQYGTCDGSIAYLNTPTPWVSTSGALTGGVGAFYSTDQLEVLQQGVSWLGDFNPDMGLLYYSPSVCNAPDPNLCGIGITFDQPVYGAGAYLEPNASGPFEASVFFFNSVYNITSGFTWSIADGQLGTGPGTALFIGAYSSQPDVYGAIFQVVDQYGGIDFAIGEAGVRPVPEPASVLLVGASMLGLGLVLRRRRRN